MYTSTLQNRDSLRSIRKKRNQRDAYRACHPPPGYSQLGCTSSCSTCPNRNLWRAVQAPFKKKRRLCSVKLQHHHGHCRKTVYKRATSTARRLYRRITIHKTEDDTRSNLCLGLGRFHTTVSIQQVRWQNFKTLEGPEYHQDLGGNSRGARRGNVYGRWAHRKFITQQVAVAMAKDQAVRIED